MDHCHHLGSSNENGKSDLLRTTDIVTQKESIVSIPNPVKTKNLSLLALLKAVINNRAGINDTSVGNTMYFMNSQKTLIMSTSFHFYAF